MTANAVRLLTALRQAGCDTFVDAEDGQFYCSPPARHVDWPGCAEEAILSMLDELRDLIIAEKMLVH